MTPERLAAFKARTEQVEGRTSWLYRDNAKAGNATCGVGHLVGSFEAARALPFTPPIQRAEWVALMTAPAGMRATTYQIDTKGRLSDSDIDALFDADIEAKLAELRARWPAFDTFPGGPQEALLDMAFNMGMETLLKFTHLCCSVDAGNWQAASGQCHRLGISEARNAATSALFLEVGA